MSRVVERRLTACLLICLLICLFVVCLAASCPPSSSDGVKLAFVGDILLDRGVGQTLRYGGPGYPYGGVRDILAASGFVFGNLEFSLTKAGSPVLKNSRLLFRADPANASALKSAGFSILNLANNHSMDYGQVGLEDTIDALQANGIYAVGAGLSRADALKPVFVKAGGMTVGYLAYSTFPAEGYFSSEDQPDVSRPDPAEIESAIARARKECDFLAVSFHWGREFDFYPGVGQKELAHRAIESGADLVVGHHPHVLQGVETYRGKLIFFSLGNFVFDRQIPEGTDDTVILRLRLQKGASPEAELLPVVIRDCRPEQARGSRASRILDRLLLYSEGMNTHFIRHQASLSILLK